MRPKQPTAFPRTLPEQIGTGFKRGPSDKLEVTNTDVAIDQTPMAKGLSAHEFDFMTYAGLGKGVWGYTSEEVVQFIQGLRS
jgi:hypothetical protein